MSLKIWLPMNTLPDYPVPNYGTLSERVTRDLYRFERQNAGKTGGSYAFFSGKTNEALDFSDYIFQDMFPQDRVVNFSVCFWYKPVTFYSTQDCLFIVHNYASSMSDTNVYFYVGIQQSSGKLEFTTRNSSGTSSSGQSTAVLSTGEWQHIALTFDGSEMKIYINGVLDSTHTSIYPPYFFTTTRAALGGFTRSKVSVNGYMNDFMFYDNYLTADEVRRVSQALVLHYPLSDPGIEPTVNYSNNLWASYQSYYIIQSQTNTSIVVKRTSTSTTSQVALYTMNVLNNMNPGEVWTLSCYLYKNGAPWKTSATRASAYLTSVVSYEARNDGYFTVTFNVPANDYQWVIHEALFGGTTTDDICEFRYLQLEKKNHATPFVIGTRTGLVAYDCSGYNRNGTVSASTCPIPVSGSARNNICYQFDGTNDYIVTSSNVTQSTILADKKFTISAWVYLTDFKEARGIFGPHESSGTKGICFCQCNGSSNKILCSFGDGSSWHEIRDDTGYSLNTWTMYTMTYDGTTAKMYKNGTLVGSTTGNIVYSANPFTVGRAYNGSDRYWQGKISDVRVYATALSADDIAQEYHRYAAIYNNHSFATSEFIEENNNLLSIANYNLTSKIENHGVSGYSQTNCTCTMTDNGLHVYRPANITGSNSQWGGMIITPTAQNGQDVLFKGHTYILKWHVKGKSSGAATDTYWHPQAGAGTSGTGLVPNPSDVSYQLIPSNFNGEMECWYKFTINEDVYKASAVSYGMFVQGQIYNTYNTFKFGWYYSDTGSIGTDLYITNIRMYDITTNNTDAKKVSIGINGVVTSSIIEDNFDKVSIFPDGEMYATEFIEEI